jgi:nucleotide-binding universal stress UspA family protein
VLDEPSLRAEAHMVTRPLTGSMVGREIAAFAEQKGVDLILLGQSGRGWWRWLSEDVASVVRRHAEAPIQIVPAQHAGRGAARLTVPRRAPC